MSNYWQGKGAGKRIAIRFTKPLLGDVTGNEDAFTIKGMVRNPLKYGPLTERTFTVESVERYPLTVFWQDDFSGEMDGLEAGEYGLRLEKYENTDYSTPAGYSIALVTTDKTHRAATYIKTVLEGKGHTVTLFNTADVTASNLDSYDVIVCPRKAGNPTTDGYLRDYIDKGIPVWVGALQATAGDYTDTTPVSLGMAAKTSLQDSRNGSYLLSVDSPITLTFDLPKQINTYSSSTWMESIYRANGFVGTPIANYSSADDKITVLAIKQGTKDLFGNPYGARCGFIGWMYSTSTTTLTADAQTILDRCIRWSLAERGYEDEGIYLLPLPATDLTSPRFRCETSTPTDTAIIIEYACTADAETEPEDWTEIEDDDLLDITDDILWLRYTLSTDDPAVTPTLLSAWLEEPEAPPDTIVLHFDTYNRFNDAEGDLTVTYTQALGTLTGVRPVEDFTESFTPTGLEPTPINVQGTITAGVEVEVDFIEVYYVDLGHKNTITAGITVEVDLIPVSEIPP